MKISFYHDWNPSLEQIATWRDGLWAALIELKQRGHDIRYFSNSSGGKHVFSNGGLDSYISDDSDTRDEIKQFKPDVILHWADSTRPNADIGRVLGVPQAICFAGGEPFEKQWNNFDHFFVESDEYKVKLEEAGVSVSTAFGTNTKLFDPENPFYVNQQKIFDICFPATYADWKRHRLFAEATKGLRTICSGYMYSDHEQWCWRLPQESGGFVLPHLSAVAIAHTYAASRACLITSQNNGGSQRTVLEALAMNVPVIVMNDSLKTSEYLIDGKCGIITEPKVNQIKDAIEMANTLKPLGRAYVMSKWTEKHYADSLEKRLYALTSNHSNNSLNTA